MTRIRASDAEYVQPEGVGDDAVVSVFRVPQEVAGQRVDVFLQGQLHRTSRTRAQAIVRASAYDASGRKLDPNDRVRPDQHILLWRPAWDERPVPCEVPVLHEDEHILVVDKPALLPVHPTARYHRNTLIKVLQAARPACAFLSLGHRLDRETSGALIVSKTRECDRALKRQLELREGVEKTYVALTWGVPDRGDGARRFRFERAVELDHGHALRVKMRVSDGPSALFAATDFEVEEVRQSASGATYARVRCGLDTGRQHQIRVHLASLGAPVVGDKLYGPDDGLFARSADDELTPADEALLELPRHALHAFRLALSHPMTGAPLSFEAPLPRDMAEFWAGLAPMPGQGPKDSTSLDPGTSAISFEPLAGAEFDEVRALAHRIWHEHYASILTPQQINYMLASRFAPENLRAYLGVRPRRMFVVRKGRGAVGYFSFARVAPDAVKLEQLYLVAELRGCGVGGRMLGFVEGQARRDGVIRVSLSVNKRNAGAIAFYERGGYSVCDSAVFDIGQGYVMDDYVMEKRLSQPHSPRGTLSRSS